MLLAIKMNWAFVNLTYSSSAPPVRFQRQEDQKDQVGTAPAMAIQASPVGSPLQLPEQSQIQSHCGAQGSPAAGSVPPTGLCPSRPVLRGLYQLGAPLLSYWSLTTPTPSLCSLVLPLF